MYEDIFDKAQSAVTNDDIRRSRVVVSIAFIASRIKWTRVSAHFMLYVRALRNDKMLNTYVFTISRQP